MSAQTGAGGILVPYKVMPVIFMRKELKFNGVYLSIRVILGNVSYHEHCKHTCASYTSVSKDFIFCICISLLSFVYFLIAF